MIVRNKKKEKKERKKKKERKRISFFSCSKKLPPSCFFLSPSHFQSDNMHKNKGKITASTTAKANKPKPTFMDFGFGAFVQETEVPEKEKEKEEQKKEMKKEEKVKAEPALESNPVTRITLKLLDTDKVKESQLIQKPVAAKKEKKPVKRKEEEEVQVKPVERKRAPPSGKESPEKNEKENKKKKQKMVEEVDPNLSVVVAEDFDEFDWGTFKFTDDSLLSPQTPMDKKMFIVINAKPLKGSESIELEHFRLTLPRFFMKSVCGHRQDSRAPSPLLRASLKWWKFECPNGVDEKGKIIWAPDAELLKGLLIKKIIWFYCGLDSFFNNYSHINNR